MINFKPIVMQDAPPVTAEDMRAKYEGMIFDEYTRNCIRRDLDGYRHNKEINDYLLSLIVTDWCNDKPVVQCYLVSGWTPIEGTWTYVKTINHPYRSNRDIVRTSRILKVYPNGSFETENTMYNPVTQGNIND